MKIRMYFGILILAMLSNMVTTQLSEVTGEGSESSSSGTTEAALSSSSLSSSPGSSSQHISSTDETSLSLSTPSQDSSTHRTLPSVQPEADSSGTGGSPSPSISSPPLSSTYVSQAPTSSSFSSIEPVHTTEEAATSPRDPSTPEVQGDTTQTSSEEIPTIESSHSETLSSEIQGETASATSEIADDSTISTVTIQTTSDVDSSTMTTEDSTVTETESTTFESTTDPMPSTTIIPTIIDASSSGGISVSTGVPLTSTSSEAPETTDDTSNLPSPESSSKESCFGQAEVNTAMIVAIVVSVNVITIAVTAFCVHRLVSRRLSWDPPPMNFHKQSSITAGRDKCSSSSSPNRHQSSQRYRM